MQSNRVSSKRYKYTKDNVYLTDEQRDFYEKNGYIVFRNLVDWDILDECNKKIYKLFDLQDDYDRMKNCLWNSFRCDV